MTTAKHTPGPWLVTRQYVVGPRDESDSQGFGMVVGVADVYGENRNQDAHLIAAAPDLLEALKGAIGALEFSRDYHADLSNAEQAFAQDRLDAALAALAKAEGRS